MAVKKTAPLVEYRRTDDGLHEIGVQLGGQFYPFARLSQAEANKLEQAEGPATDTSETNDDGEES